MGDDGGVMVVDEADGFGSGVGSAGAEVAPVVGNLSN